VKLESLSPSMCRGLFSIFNFGRVLPVSGRWPVAKRSMNKSRKVAKLAEIDGTWHKLVINGNGYDQWIPCAVSHRDIPNELKQDADLGLLSSHSVAVDHLLDLVDKILPDDFIAYLRREAEAVSGHRIGKGVVLKADGNVVKVSVHISLSLENAEPRRGDDGTNLK